MTLAPPATPGPQARLGDTGATGATGATGDTGPTGPTGGTIFTAIPLSDPDSGGNGGNGGDGIRFSGGSVVSNVYIHNAGGVLQGGNGGNGYLDGSGGDGGDGVGILAMEEFTANGGFSYPPPVGGLISNVNILNDAGSLIAGGNGGLGGVTGAGGNGGNGISLGAAVMTDITITNSGIITGGNGGAGTTGGSGGAGIALNFYLSFLPGAPPAGEPFEIATAGRAINITNYGLIKGGDGGPGGAAGEAIDIQAPDSADETHATIVNWGEISEGTGGDGEAIHIYGSDNVVKLMGHSTVNGLINATGNPKSNYLDLDFSG